MRLAASIVTHTSFSHQYSRRYARVCKEAFTFASVAYRTRVFRQRFFRPRGVIANGRGRRKENVRTFTRDSKKRIAAPCSQSGNMTVGEMTNRSSRMSRYSRATELALKSHRAYVGAEKQR